MATCEDTSGSEPGKVGWAPPRHLRAYLLHTEHGLSLRQIARMEGCHASTVLRNVRKAEASRDDPLVDRALERLGRSVDLPVENGKPEGGRGNMNMTVRSGTEEAPGDAREQEMQDALRHLGEEGACLAVARDMEKAVVVRETADGRTLRTAVIDAGTAQAMALREWIACISTGRVSRYRLSEAGRAVLACLEAEDAARQVPHHPRGQSDIQISPGGNGGRRRAPYSASESPVAALARRRNKDGEPYIGPDLLAAAERLREDFELARIGPRVTQNWERFLEGGERRAAGSGSDPAAGASDARDRVAAALRALGPGLGDVVLRVCCYEEGLETAERRLGWSARSGKVVLQIALERLRKHYETAGQSVLIG